jgi:hypothetical protein
MAAFLLQQLRREHLVTRKKPDSSSIINKIQMTKAKQLDRKFG